MIMILKFKSKRYNFKKNICMLSRRKRAEARVEVQQLSPILMIAQVSHMETALEWWDPSVRVHNVTLLTKASKLDYPDRKSTRLNSSHSS